jgi:hypothetical protein
MRHARDICETAFKNGAAVLMARIVDGAGIRVRRDQMAFIRYSISEVDPCDLERRQSLVAHADVPIDVDEVFLDSLETGGLWDVDAVGYNFRHEIRPGANRKFPPGARYEIRYVFQPKNCGGSMIVRFHVRFKPK